MTCGAVPHTLCQQRHVCQLNQHRASGEFRRVTLSRHANDIMCRTVAVRSGERPSLGRPQYSSRNSGSSLVRQSCVCHQHSRLSIKNVAALSAASIHQMAAVTAGGLPCYYSYGSKRDCSILSPNVRLQRPFRPGNASLVLCQVCSAAECNVDCSPA